MRSLSRVTLIGYLAADPEMRQTKLGRFVANFPLAINRNVKTEEGKKQEVADFHRIVAWSKLADICSQYLFKGMGVFVEGRLINTSYDDKDGVRHFRTEIVADTLNILTPKKSEVEVETADVKEKNKEKTLASA
ncbi:MAG: single-stranded DNA-binding protein [bacterium]|nr:single-stranded DNA-binding protein [bacterium]